MYHDECFIQNVRSFAEKRKDIVAVHIFGSMATGRHRNGSDTDISLMTNRHIDGFERISMETVLSDILKCDVDLSIFSQSNPLLQHQILKYGKLIYESDIAERVRQEVFSRYEYLDSKFLFKEIGNNEDG